MHGAVHGLAVAAADGVGDDDVRAERDADEQIQQQPDDRTVCTDSGHGDRAQLTREVTDDGDVGRVEQLPEDAGRRDRQGVARELAPERPVEHVHMPLFGHCLHTFLTFCSNCVKIQRHIIREAQPGIKAKFV